MIDNDIGRANPTNEENYPMVHVWFEHKDGTISQHLLTTNELKRTSIRASQNPSLCFPLCSEEDENDRREEETEEKGQEADSS